VPAVILDETVKEVASEFDEEPTRLVQVVGLAIPESHCNSYDVIAELPMSLVAVNGDHVTTI
jgi:hypothetical protein